MSGPASTGLDECLSTRRRTSSGREAIARKGQLRRSLGARRCTFVIGLARVLSASARLGRKQGQRGHLVDSAGQRRVRERLTSAERLARTACTHATPQPLWGRGAGRPHRGGGEQLLCERSGRPAVTATVPPP